MSYVCSEQDTLAGTYSIGTSSVITEFTHMVTATVLSTVNSVTNSQLFEAVGIKV